VVESLIAEEDLLDLSTDTPIGKAIDYVMQKVNLLELLVPFKGLEYDDVSHTIWLHFSDSADEGTVDQLIRELESSSATVLKQPSHLEDCEWMVVLMSPQNPASPKMSGTVQTAVSVSGQVPVGGANG
jgi:hypothetical protein